MEESGETVEFVPERRPNLTTTLEQYKLATDVKAALENVLETHHSFSKRVVSVEKKTPTFEGLNQNEEKAEDDEDEDEDEDDEKQISLSFNHASRMTFHPK